MRRIRRGHVLTAAVAVALCIPASGASTGNSAGALPTKIGPDTPPLWKVPLPPGHSSPVVYGHRIYVTGVRDQKLVTIAL